MPLSKSLTAAALVALTLGACTTGREAVPTTASLDVTLVVGEPSGAVMVALFNDADAYNGGGQPFRATRVTADATQVMTSFTGLAPGTYAMRAFHDLNGDGVLNTNPLGTPIEPYAFSNGARARFGPPKFAEAAMELSVGDNNATLKFTR